MRGPLRFKAIEAAIIVLVAVIAPVPLTVGVTAGVYVVAVVMLELDARGRLQLSA
jgi:hypothetical protein